MRHLCFQSVSFHSKKREASSRAMQAGHDLAVQYRELLQMVMHNLSRPSAASMETRASLGNVSRKIAQCVTELATAAELLKDDDWVDPSDPTFIAENELLGAAKSIENAAKKLASLKPRKEIKGKVGRWMGRLVCLKHFFYPLLTIRVSILYYYPTHMYK